MGRRSPIERLDEAPVDQRETAPEPTAAPAREQVLAVQRSAGNAAVADWLGPRSLAREPAVDAISGADPAARDSPVARQAIGTALEARVAAVQTLAIQRRESVTEAVRKCLGTVDATRVDLEAFAAAYDVAWKAVQAKIEEGKAKAKDDEALAGLVMNVAIGVSIGLGIGGVIAVAERAGRMAFSAKLILETAGEGLEWVVGQAVQGATQPSVPGKDDAFDRAHPGLKRAAAFEQLMTLYRRLVLLSLEAAPAARISDACGRAMGDMRELAIKGEHKRHSVAALTSGVEGLERAVAEQAKLETAIVEVSAGIDAAAKEAKAARAAIDPKQLQKHIWIHWMASLQGDEIGLLDADPIEDELHALKLEGPSSQIGWNTGKVHTAGDSESGVRKARMYSMALGMVGKQGTFHLSGNRPYTKSPYPPDPGEAREHGVVTMDDEPGARGSDAGMWPKWDYEVRVQDGAQENDRIVIAGVFAATGTKRQGVVLYGRRVAPATAGAGRTGPAPL